MSSSQFFSNNRKFNMRPAVTAICFFALVASNQAKTIAPSWKQLADKLVEQCTKETNATPEQVKIITSHAEIPKDDGQKCFMECVYKTTGVILDGKFNLKAAEALVDMKYKGDEKKLGRKIVSDCSGKVASKEGEKCSMGRAIRECLIGESKEFDLVLGV